MSDQPVDLKALLSDGLVSTSKGGGQTKVPAAVLDGKVVGLYFSAHWCNPCKKFTPHLASLYKALKSSGQQFEVIFVSRDSSEAEFQSYFAEMPWLALPFKSSVPETLLKQFDIKSIPSLVLIDGSGKVLTTAGRAAAVQDPQGANFPWPGFQEPKKSGSKPFDWTLFYFRIAILAAVLLYTWWNGSRSK